MFISVTQHDINVKVSSLAVLCPQTNSQCFICYFLTDLFNWAPSSCRTVLYSINYIVLV